MALLEEMVGEGTEFKLVLEVTPPHTKWILNHAINSYINPTTGFSSALTRENNTNVFRFFRAYRPLQLRPEVFKYATQLEENTKSYGAMLGFAIAHLSEYNLTKEEINNYFRACENAILFDAQPNVIEQIGKAFVLLRSLSERGALSGEQLNSLTSSLTSANSPESVDLTCKEIAKVNRMIGTKKQTPWPFSPQLA